AVLFVAGGGGAALNSKSQFLFTVAAAKMNAPALALFARAVLCNWLVCLAIWMSARMTSDAAKCIAIFWCLFGFIGSGYEHSVANMTLLLIALLGNHPDTVTWGGFAHNLFWVTLGNIVSGAGFMALGYSFVSGPVAGGEQWAEPFEADCLLGAALAIAASGDCALDIAFATAAQVRGLPVNVVDRPELSSFIMPAIVDRGPITVAVSTGGTSPTLAQIIRDRIERALPLGIGQLAW